MSILGFVNFVFLQWFTLRLAKVSHQGRTWAKLYRGIVPLTGWWSDYRTFKWSNHNNRHGYMVVFTPSSEQLERIKAEDIKGFSIGGTVENNTDCEK